MFKRRWDPGSLSWAQVVGQVLTAGSCAALLSWLVSGAVEVDIVVVVVVVHAAYLVDARRRRG